MAQDEDEKAKREHAESLRRQIAALRDKGSRHPPSTPRDLAEQGAEKAREEEPGGPVEDKDPGL